MGYFQNQQDRPHRQLFHLPLPPDEPDGPDLPEETDLPPEGGEEAERRRLRFQMLADIGDLLGIIGCTAGILVLVALLVSLVSWVQTDVNQFFMLYH